MGEVRDVRGRQVEMIETAAAFPAISVRADWAVVDGISMVNGCG